jgi:DNA-binding XRE family transcriptional regulator
VQKTEARFRTPRGWRSFLADSSCITLQTAAAITTYSRCFISTGDLSLPRKPSFARYLREARIRRGLSVSDVAEQVGVSTSSIYFWETDHCRPRDANLTALCRALKLPIKATKEMASA